ncbi:MAG: UDP-N-acetylmuramoyl-L-alanine--D-glutamate ligase [Sandaracinus sp.]|nr:UDP-N-acetylmuramoyl-L-alanine--D-glutamate ligase [Sandaracinus sp.]MCB9630789.1 UDP-N-acetylmuramoyl-L-alanine--D-glutamate ligase [Sandaracinus sp.]
MDLKGKRILVVGLGKSGIAAARLLMREGARVVLNDRRTDVEGLEPLVALGAEAQLGHHDEALFTSVDAVVLSPGVPPLPAIDAADAAGVPVWSEIELGARFLRGYTDSSGRRVQPPTVIGITGTNGKSTVTSLLGAMAAKTGRPTFVGGNLGVPFVDVVGTDAAGPEGFVVVELSSFQLERVDTFRAHVALLLNVTEDHLDRYPGMAEYAAAKGRLFHGQRKEDHAIVPAGDELCAALARAGAAKLHRYAGFVRGEESPKPEVFVDGDALCDTKSGLRFPIAELKIRGGHNLANAASAMLAARLAGIGQDAIVETLRTFGGLPHRMFFVRERGGVRFYDDSKATNVGATVAALEGFATDPSFTGKVVLLAGGKDKGGSYAPMVESLRRVGREVVTLGEAAPLLEAALGDVPFQRAADFDDAVTRAARLAQPGDAVVLAPACSSFDMFRSYAERGERFQRAVLALPEVG